MFEAEKVKDACVQWIRDWFEENGKGCNAVVGISGGKDSSVCAALCVEALGKDRVIGVTMPNGVTDTIPLNPAKKEYWGKFRVVSLADTFARMILRVYNYQPISSEFPL